ncbi:M23 family metallopeptidase [Kitasatospora sp. NPDC051914]|uniref:M23 family metallopeptidase n=1 Tax=Kitasatospora sp. NPDC051914 TaxID=3154945 RepID=UPI00343D3E1D
MTVRRSPVRIPIRIPIHRPLPGSAGTADRPRAQHRGPRPSTTRRAVLTVALPSAATLGVFGVAAATVHADRTRLPGPPQSGPHTPSRGPAGQRPDDDRADRELARAALAARRQSERQREDEQRPAEAVRPPYVLPVDAPGPSARFGQAGPHRAARHTGLDFPVAAGTPVRAVTDGTVTTGWSGSYGYLAVVTAADGTETWYAHLSGYRVRGGRVRAGEVIGLAGATGNATGPHLHFEVRPAGGAPVDPLPWLLAHGLDPRRR